MKISDLIFYLIAILAALFFVVSAANIDHISHTEGGKKKSASVYNLND